jgi:hypothetical protein
MSDTLDSQFMGGPADMLDHKKEIAELKAQNKKLKALLKNAVQLLHQSKQIIQRAAKPPARKAVTRRRREPR